MSEADFSTEQARQKAKSQQWTPQKVVNDLDPNNLYDHRFVKWCETVRSELVPELKQALWQKEGYSCLHIGHLLLQLGEPDGAEGIMACLRSSDPYLRRSALSTLSVLPIRSLTEDSPPWQRPPVPISKEALLVALEPFLDEPASQEGSIAIDIALELGLSQANQRLIPLLNYDSQKVRMQVASGFLRRGEDHGALGMAESLLFHEKYYSYESYKLISALEYCAKGKNPGLALRAADLLIRYILENLNRSDNETANRVWNAMQGLEAVRHPQEAQTLQAVLQSSVEAWARGIALCRLGELEGEAGIIRLQNALSDTQLREFAAEGIAKVAKGRGDIALINNLAAILQEETRPKVLGAIVDALIAVGGNIISVLDENTSRFNPYDAMRILWISKGITPETAAQQLVAAGVIRPPCQKLLGQLQESWQTNHQPFGIIFSLLDSSHRVTAFDCETSTAPVDHVRLIEDLIEISSDIFEVEAVSQSWQSEIEDAIDEDLGYEVQFIYDNKVYRFNAEYLGDWYDVSSVIQALNHALEEAQRLERFFLLHTGDQMCLVTFAPTKAFLEVAEQLYIPLEHNLQSAMERGIAYEQYVRQTIQEEASGSRHD